MHISFKAWKEYFQHNSGHFNHVRFLQKPQLNNEERSLITSSIQQFQKGESSEGFHLLKAAKRYNEEYFETIQLFIKEEQKHAAVLARFMRQENIPFINNHWTDSAFRGLRKFFSIQNTITVLMTAEILAAVYYQALWSATSSPVLKSICEQILSDEEMHIHFQAFSLRQFYLKNSWFKRNTYKLYQRVLIFATTLVVWLCHRQIFIGADVSFAKYTSIVRKEFKQSMEMIEGFSEIKIRKQVLSKAI